MCASEMSTKTRDQKETKRNNDSFDPSIITASRTALSEEELLVSRKAKKKEGIDNEGEAVVEKAGEGARTPKDDKLHSRSRSKSYGKRSGNIKVKPMKEKEKEEEEEDYCTSPSARAGYLSPEDRSEEEKGNTDVSEDEEGEMDWREMAAAYGWAFDKRDVSDGDEEDREPWPGRGKILYGRQGVRHTERVGPESEVEGDAEEEDQDDIPLNTLVRLNVGGKKYITTMMTLKSLGENFLTRMVRNDMHSRMSSVKDDEGYFFVDRNGSVFEIVLDYLREHSTLVLPASIPYPRVLRELEFYGIPYRGILDLKPKYTKASMEAISHWQTNVNKIVAEHIQKWKTSINTQIMKGCCPAIIKHPRTEGPKFHYGPFSYSQAHSGLFQKLLALTLQKSIGMPTSVHLELTDNPLELSNLVLVFNLDDDMLSGRKYDFLPTSYSDWTLNKLHDAVSRAVVRGAPGTGFRTYNKK